MPVPTPGIQLVPASGTLAIAAASIEGGHRLANYLRTLVLTGVTRFRTAATG
jgi:hypothetical protein